MIITHRFQPDQLTVIEMSVADVLRAIAWHEQTTRRLERQAVAVVLRTTAAKYLEQRKRPMREETAAPVVPDAHARIMREVKAAQQADDLLYLLVRRSMPLWKYQRVNLDDALNRWWPR